MEACTVQMDQARAITATFNPSGPAPRPCNLAVSGLPENAKENEWITFTVSASNCGTAPADDGGISVSFPDLASPGDNTRVTSTGGTLTVKECDAQEPNCLYLRTPSGTRLPATLYVATEAYGKWPVNATRSMEVKVKPKTGQFRIQVRQYLAAPFGYLGTPTAGPVDQQGWEVTSYTINVASCSAPSITSHPANQTIQEGGTATLSVLAQGDGLKYQWYRVPAGAAPVLVPGANDAVYTTPELTETATYRVIVKNSCERETASRDAVITVTPGELDVDFSIADVEITQGVQTLNFDGVFKDEDHQEPMRTDKPVIVRAWVKADKSPSSLLTVSGTIEVQTGENTWVKGKQLDPAIIGSENVVSGGCSLPCSLKETSATQTVWFRLDPEGIPAGSHKIRLRIRPDNGRVDANPSNDQIEFSHSWQAPATNLRVSFVAVNLKRWLNAWGSLVDEVIDANLVEQQRQKLCDWIGAALPHMSVECTYDGVITREIPKLFDQGSQLLAIVKADFSPDADLLVYFISTGLDGFDGQADLPCGGSGNLTRCVDRKDCDAGFEFGVGAWVHFFGDSVANTATTLVHEVLHTRGLVHNTCDVLSPLIRPSTPSGLDSMVFQPGRELKNIMDYDWGTKGIGARDWGYLKSDLAGSKQHRRLVDLAAPASSYWSVHGGRTPSGWSVYFAEPAAAPLSPVSGPFVLRLLDVSGKVLNETSFGIRPAEADDQYVFSVSVPVIETARTFAILEQGKEVARLTRDLAIPAVAIKTPARGAQLGGTFDVAWTASHPAGAPLTFDVAYSADGGTSWTTVGSKLSGNALTLDPSVLRGSNNGVIRVRATDGFNSAEATVDGLEIPLKNPTLTVTSSLKNALITSSWVTVDASYSNIDDSRQRPSEYLWSLSGCPGGTPLSERSSTLTLTALNPGPLTVSARVENPRGGWLCDEVTFVVADPSPVSLAATLPFGYVVPAAAHAPGLGSTFWKTDAVVYNPGSVFAQVQVHFLSADQNNAGTSGVRFPLGPGESRKIEDIASSLFSMTSANGAILVTSSHPVIVTSRTSNDPGTGSYGLFAPGLPAATAIGAGEKARLIQLTKNGRFRTNVGIANISGTPIDVQAAYFRSDGLNLGGTSYRALPFSLYQAPNPLAAFSSQDVNDAYVTLESSTPGARYFTYATSIDSLTGDPIFIVPVKAGTAENPVYVAASAHIGGAQGETWRTDLEIHNPGSIQAAYAVSLLKAGMENSDPDQKMFTLDPGKSIRYGDVLNTFFGFSGGAALRVQPSTGSVLVTSRTYNDDPEGTFGLFVPGIPLAESIAAGQAAILVQLSRSADREKGFRTNLGFANVTAIPVSLRITLHDGSGKLMGTLTQDLAPFGQVQRNDVFKDVTAGDVENGYAVVTSATASARFLAYATVVDNRSGDAIYVPASREGP